MTKRKSKTANAPSKQLANDSYIAEQKRLLKRIHKLTRRVHQLKLRHNALSPINRLPGELLLRIFFHLQSDYRKQKPKEYYQWTAVTQVSECWRMLALDTRRLWNITSFDNEFRVSPWITMCMDRSSSLDLDVVVKFDVNGSQWVYFAKILEVSRRMSSLYVTVEGKRSSNRNLAEFLRWLGTIHVSCLAEVTIIGTKDATAHPPIHLTSLFTTPTPALQSLLIQNMGIDLGSISFTNLTALHLLYEAGDPGVVSFPTLLDALRMPHLQSLKLSHAIVDSHEPGPSALIPLSSLSNLELNLPAHQCVIFLFHTIIPKSCYATIRGILSPPNGETPGTPGPVLRYTTPQSFFDATLYLIRAIPVEFTGMRIHIRADAIHFALRRPEAMLGVGPWGKASINICPVFPQGRNPTSSPSPELLTLPDLSRFTSVYWVFLSCHPYFVRGAPQGLVQTVISKLQFPSIDELTFSSSLLYLVTRHLQHNTSSFGKLAYMTVRDIRPQGLDGFEAFVQTLSRWKEMWGVPLRVLALNGESRGWLRDTLVPYVQQRLNGVVDEVRIKV